MCIICNVGHGTPDQHIRNVGVASDFLTAFAAAQQKMKAAADLMLDVSKIAAPDHRARYDATHKEMVRQIREWNKLEEKRENPTL